MRLTPKWTPEQIQALTESIAHYERAVLDRREPLGAPDCACCRRWNHGPTYCRGCPIHATTGQTGCRETPYVVNGKELGDLQDDSSYSDYQYFALVQRELDFLRRVLASGTDETTVLVSTGTDTSPEPKEALRDVAATDNSATT